MSDLHAVERGDQMRPAVVCIHGLLGSSRNMLRLVEGIANAGFHVVAYDQRGHGHSPHSNDYSLKSLASDAFEVMNAKGLEAAHFVGHSLGARVALAAAGLHPQRVLSLAMLDAGVKTNPSALAEVHGVVDPLPMHFEDKAQAEVFLSRFDLSIKNFLLSNLRADECRFRWNFDLEGARSLLRFAISQDQEEIWKHLKCPALVLRGGRSTYFADEEVAKMLSLNPLARSAVIPKAGHWVHVDNFPDTLSALLAFLGGVN